MYENIVTVQNLTKSVYMGDERRPVLKSISCTIRQGDFVVIYGPPGCGKSLLLYSILGIEQPTCGEVYIEDSNISRMSEYERTNFRRQRVGILYGHPLWVGSLNVIKNMEFLLHLSGYPGAVEEKARELLRMANVEECAECHPAELDSLQQQQIALARALVTEPNLLVADDPTRHLDLLSGHKLMQTFQQLRQYGKTVIVFTCTRSFLCYANRQLSMDKGILKEELTSRSQVHSMA